MKITMYELLGLIKDGKAPKKILYNGIGSEYNKDTKDYYPYYGKYLFEYKFADCIDFLEDEVEIIEEPKKIEHCLKGDRFLCDKAEMEHLRTKIDELIDEVNKLKGEK